MAIREIVEIDEEKCDGCELCVPSCAEGAIQMVDVHFPTTEGRTLIMPRYTEPELGQQMLLDKLRLKLPAQPPPRIRNGNADLPQGPAT